MDVVPSSWLMVRDEKGIGKDLLISRFWYDLSIPGSASYGRLTRFIGPDGEWEVKEYDRVSGNLLREIKSYLGSRHEDWANTNLHEVIDYGYDPCE